MSRVGVRIIAGVLVAAAGAFLAGGTSLAADDSPRLLWGNVGRLGVGGIPGVDQADEADEAGKPGANLGNGFDLLRGNGSPAGYILTHGNIVLDTLSVSVDGRRLVRNRDYFVDPVSGALSFAEPVSSLQTIRASYRYNEGKSVARSLVGLPLLPAFFGGSSNASFLHAYRGADAKGGLPFDVLTFGMKMDFDLGNVGLESMLYMSDPRRPGAKGLFDKDSGKAPRSLESDQIVSQKARVELGDARLSFGYQDVGSNFTGFATLREQGALPKEVVDQLEREKGVRRLSAALELRPNSLMPEGSPWNRLSWVRLYDSSGALDSIQLVYNEPRIGFLAAFRSVDPAFRRLASLSQDELSQLALVAKLQFDPNATVGQVTDADRKAVLQEAGISRHLLNTYVKLNPKLTGTLSFVNLTDGRGDIARQTFSLAGADWQGWVASQTISSSFARLGALAPSEQARFGNEYGTHRVEGGLNARVAGRLSLNSDWSVLRSEVGDVRRMGLGLAGKYLNFKAGYQDIDPTFVRIGDLADPRKQQMASERGFRIYDVALGGQLSPALKLDTAYRRGDNDAEDLFRRSEVLNLMYAPSDRSRVSLQHSLSLNGSQGEIVSGAMRDIFAMEQRFRNNWFVSVSRDSNLTRAAGGSLAGSVVRAYQAETDRSRPTWLSWSERRTDSMTGSFEYVTSWNVQTRAGERLTVKGARSTVDRGRDPSEEVNRLAVDWAAARSLNVTMESFTRSTNYAGDGFGYRLALGGQAAETLGPLSKINLTAEYGSTRLNGNVVTFVRGLNIDALWGKNVLGVEYSHQMLANGKRHLGRGYRFKSDPDKEKAWHLDLYVKDKDLGWGSVKPVRNIAFDIRLGPASQLAYALNQNKELPNGVIELVTSQSFKLTTRLAGSLNLVLDHRLDDNDKAKTSTLKNSIGLQRQAQKGMVVDVYYGRDEARTPTGEVKGHSIRLRLDQQISHDRFLTFTGEATKWDNSNPSIPDRTTAEARLDFRMPFDL